MQQFLKHLFYGFIDVCGAKQHHKFMFFSSMTLYILLSFICGYIGSLMLLMVYGILGELVYCYIPDRKLRIFGKKIKVPDYTIFRKGFSIRELEEKHTPKIKNLVFFIDGVILGIILRLILSFLLFLT